MTKNILNIFYIILNYITYYTIDIQYNIYNIILNGIYIIYYIQLYHIFSNIY